MPTKCLCNIAKTRKHTNSTVCFWSKRFFKVDDKEKATNILTEKFSITDITILEDGLECKLKNDIIPYINKSFVENNIKVFAISPKRTLEEYFLSVTDNNEKH